MSSDQMEVVEKSLPCWFSFSMDDFSCGFEPDEDFVSKGLVFDDAASDFVQNDPAFANAKPVVLDEVYLVKSLRNKMLDQIIPSEAFEFYESCFQKSFQDFFYPPFGRLHQKLCANPEITKQQPSPVA